MAMSDRSFTDFLDQLSGETGSRRKPEPPRKKTINEDHNNRKERVQKAEPKPQNKPVVEEKKPMKNNRIDEEFMDKAYDYAQGVIKVVRNNFSSTEERVAMLESLENAIDLYLQSLGRKQKTPSIQSQPVVESSGGFFSGPKISESDWDNTPTISNETFESVAPPSVPKGPAPSGAYDPSLKIGIKITPDGKQEADLSGVTANDIQEMQMLAGMIGPEAEQKQKEMQAAVRALKEGD
jgi:hypothetical protein